MKLVVWQRARSLTVAVHEVLQEFPPNVAPGLRAQLMRAVRSISANVAEGAARSSRRDFARFVSIAADSSSEAEHHLNVASDLGLIDEVIVGRLIDRVTEVRRMLFGLQRAPLAKDLETRTSTHRTSDQTDAEDSQLLH